MAVPRHQSGRRADVGTLEYGVHAPGDRLEIDPGKVFDLMLPLERVAEGYPAMDERRAVKTLLCP